MMKEQKKENEEEMQIAINLCKQLEEAHEHGTWNRNISLQTRPLAQDQYSIKNAFQ